MYWLAINREPVSFDQLQEDIVTKGSPSKLLEALFSLQQRSFIEKTSPPAPLLQGEGSNLTSPPTPLLQLKGEGSNLTSPPTPLLQLKGEGSNAPPFPTREGGLGGLGQPALNSTLTRFTQQPVIMEYMTERLI